MKIIMVHQGYTWPSSCLCAGHWVSYRSLLLLTMLPWMSRGCRSVCVFCVHITAVFGRVFPLPHCSCLCKRPPERLGSLQSAFVYSVSLTTSFQSMHRGEWLDKPRHLYLQLSHRQIYTFVRFKLGCHASAMNIVAESWQGVRTPRLQRNCDKGTFGALDDERHLVLGIMCSSLCGRTMSI